MYLRLNDVFPDWLTGDGIFYYLQSQDLIPWKDVNIADIPSPKSLHILIPGIWIKQNILTFPILNVLEKFIIAAQPVSLVSHPNHKIVYMRSTIAMQTQQLRYVIGGLS